MFVALLGAGCLHGGGSGVDAARLPRLVLQPRDVPPPFVQFDEGRQIGADQPGGARADRARFGRVDGWKTRYRRSGTPETRGPLVVESRADVFRDGGGAERELQAIRRERAGLARPVDDLGDDALLFSLRQGNVVFVTVAWRDENVIAVVNANGFAGKLTDAEVLALARVQQRRIEAATA